MRLAAGGWCCAGAPSPWPRTFKAAIWARIYSHAHDPVSECGPDAGLEGRRAFARTEAMEEGRPDMRKLGNALLVVGLVAACQSPTSTSAPASDLASPSLVATPGASLPASMELWFGGSFEFAGPIGWIGWLRSGDVNRAGTKSLAKDMRTRVDRNPRLTTLRILADAIDRIYDGDDGVGLVAGEYPSRNKTDGLVIALSTDEAATVESLTASLSAQINAMDPANSVEPSARSGPSGEAITASATLENGRTIYVARVIADGGRVFSITFTTSADDAAAQFDAIVGSVRYAP